MLDGLQIAGKRSQMQKKMKGGHNGLFYGNVFFLLLWVTRTVKKASLTYTFFTYKNNYKIPYLCPSIIPSELFHAHSSLSKKSCQPP